MPTLRVAVDATGAKTGAEKYKRAVKSGIVDTSKQADRAVRGVDKSVGVLGKTVKSAGRSIGLLFAGFAGVAGVKAATNVISKFEESMAIVQGVTSATKREFRELEATAKDLGATTRFTATQAAEGLTFLARAGFSATEAMAALPATLNLAIAGQLELGEAADFASNILSQFGLEAENTVRIVDVLTKTANSSNTNVRQLAEAMKFAGPIAGSLGKEIEEVAAAVGVLGDSGIQASLAGTNMRGVMLALAGPTGGAADALQRLGLSMDDVNPEKNNLISIFRRFRDVQLDAATATEIFGRRNAAAALILAKGAEKVGELTLANERAAGAAQKMADIQNKTLAGSIRSLISAIEALTLATGEFGLASAMKFAVDTMTQAVRILAGVKDAMADANVVAIVFAETLKVAGIALGIIAGRAVLRGLQVLGARLLAITTQMIAARVASVAMVASLTGGATVAAATPFGLVAAAIAVVVVGIIEVTSALTAGGPQAQKFADALGEVNNATKDLIKLQGELARAVAVGELEKQLRIIELLRDKYVEAREAGAVAADSTKDQAITLGELARSANRTVKELTELDRVSALIVKKNQEIQAEPFTTQTPVRPEFLKLTPQDASKILGDLVQQFQSEIDSLSVAEREVRVQLALDIKAPTLTKEVGDFMRKIRGEIDRVSTERLELGVTLDNKGLQEGSLELRRRLAIAKAVRIEEIGFVAAIEKEQVALDDLKAKHEAGSKAIFALAKVWSEAEDARNRVATSKDLEAVKAETQALADQIRAQRELIKTMEAAGPQRERAIKLIDEMFTKLGLEEAAVKKLKEQLNELNNVTVKSPLDEYLADLREQVELLKLGANEAEQFIILQEAQAAATRSNVQWTDDLQRQVENLVAQLQAARAASEDFEDATKTLGKVGITNFKLMSDEARELAARMREAHFVGEQIGDTFFRAFESAAFGARSFNQALRDLAISLSRLALNETLGNILRGGFGSLGASLAAPNIESGGLGGHQFVPVTEAPQGGSTIFGARLAGSGAGGGGGGGIDTPGGAPTRNLTINFNMPNVRDRTGFRQSTKQAAAQFARLDRRRD